MKISIDLAPMKRAPKLRAWAAGCGLAASMLLTTSAAQAQCGSNPDFVVFPDSSGTPSLVFVINETVQGTGGDGIGTIVMGSSTGTITQTQVLQIGPQGNIVPDNSDGCGSQNTAGVYLDKTGILEMLGGFIQPINFTISGPEAADVATGGVLKGFGTVESGGDFFLDFDVQNGTVNPVGGILNLIATEDSIQLTNSKLKLTLGAPTAAFLNVAGGGANFVNTKLVVDFAPGFTPVAGQEFTVVKFSGGTGSGLLTNAAGDDLNEGDTVTVNGVNLTISYTGGTSGLDIVLRNGLPAISINNPKTVYEGSAAAPGSTTFTVSLAAPSSQTVTVKYYSVNGPAGTLGAVIGSDFTSANGTLTFAPGQTSKTVTVNFIGETVAELNEKFFLDLKTPTNGIIANKRGTAYIRNDDGPGITIANAVTVNEGNTGTVPQTFTVTLSAASSNTVTVNFATAGGTAASGTDFTAQTGTLTFTPGQTSKTITVLVRGDTAVEANEKYFVNLTSPTFAVVTTSQASGFIRNDDSGTGIQAAEEPSA